MSTQDLEYTRRLIRKEAVWWKRLLDVQAPYRWNLRRLNLGHTLDVGCGIGRNLLHLQGNGVGVDHNPASVAEARKRGLLAYTSEEFLSASPTAMNEQRGTGKFDSILISHVMEHMDQNAGIELIATYLHTLKEGGRIVLITPQEAGYRSDATHVEFFDFESAKKVAEPLGLELVKRYSFPFPRFFGRFFKYNEFISVLRRG